MRFEDPAAIAKSRAAVASWKTLQGESNFALDDCDDTAASPPTRPVRAKCLIRRCPSYDLTVLLTRADSETETHVLLLYDPKTETADGKP